MQRVQILHKPGRPRTFLMLFFYCVECNICMKYIWFSHHKSNKTTAFKSFVLCRVTRISATYFSKQPHISHLCRLMFKHNVTKVSEFVSSTQNMRLEDQLLHRRLVKTNARKPRVWTPGKMLKVQARRSREILRRNLNGVVEAGRMVKERNWTVWISQSWVSK